MQIPYLNSSKLLLVLKIKKCGIIRVEYGELLFLNEKILLYITFINSYERVCEFEKGFTKD